MESAARRPPWTRPARRAAGRAWRRSPRYRPATLVVGAEVQNLRRTSRRETRRALPDRSASGLRRGGRVRSWEAPVRWFVPPMRYRPAKRAVDAGILFNLGTGSAASQGQISLDPKLGPFCDSRGKSADAIIARADPSGASTSARGTGARREIPRRGNEGWLRPVGVRTSIRIELERLCQALIEKLKAMDVATLPGVRITLKYVWLELPVATSQRLRFGDGRLKAATHSVACERREVRLAPLALKIWAFRSMDRQPGMNFIHACW